MKPTITTYQDFEGDGYIFKLWIPRSYIIKIGSVRGVKLRVFYWLIKTLLYSWRVEK